MVVHGDQEVLAVLAELGLELARAAGAGIAEVGFVSGEEVTVLEALDTILGLVDGDMEVGV